MMVNNTTPLIKINEKIYAKLETYQPTGSVKDRMVSYIIDQALRDGKITPGYTELIEATSGNTGISLAAYAARLCCPCTIVMPQNMSEQRKTMMKRSSEPVSAMNGLPSLDQVLAHNPPLVAYREIA